VLRFRLMVKRGPRTGGLKHQKEKRSMEYFAGLDVSVKDTSVCIVDGTGRIIREVKVVSEPDALLAAPTGQSYLFPTAPQCSKSSGRSLATSNQETDHEKNASPYLTPKAPYNHAAADSKLG
jgi:hypothetical protein